MEKARKDIIWSKENANSDYSSQAKLYYDKRKWKSKRSGLFKPSHRAVFVGLCNKMDYKAAAAISGCEVHDFSVYPLEGVWNLKHGGKLIKEDLEYTIMIRQPDFVTEKMAAAALERVKTGKPNPLYAEIRFDTMEDGKCIEILHIGPYDDEPASFEKMAQFAKNNGLERRESRHREIYLNNAGRVEKSKLKTILRYSVR